MNNHYNEIALGQLGKLIDNIVYFSFEKHLWVGIIGTIIILLLIIALHWTTKQNIKWWNDENSSEVKDDN